LLFNHFGNVGDKRKKFHFNRFGNVRDNRRKLLFKRFGNVRDSMKKICILIVFVMLEITEESCLKNDFIGFDHSIQPIDRIYGATIAVENDRSLIVLRQ
jgi:hypothetical protein